jgi:hypothetical protein
MTSRLSRRWSWFNARPHITRQHLLHILQRQPTKHPANPILVAERPWEGQLLQLFTAIGRDPSDTRWQMWYEGHPAEVLLCTAFSDDAIRWSRPELGIEPWQGSRANNIVLQTGYWDAHQASVVRAPDGGDPARRYRMYYWVGPEYWSADNPVLAAVGFRVKDYPRNGWYVAYSPDGLTWTPQLDAPVLAGQWQDGVERLAIGDFNTVFWDEQRGCYVSYHKLDKHRPGWELSRRCLGLAFSDDGIRFDRSRSVLDPDDADDTWARERGGIRAEFYGMHVWPHDGYYLGLLWMFLVTRTGAPPLGRGWDDGPIAPQLVFSLDGERWERLPVREPFIPLGPAGSFEAGTIYSGDRPITIGDELLFHYHGCSYTHGFAEPINSPNMLTGIGVARLPRGRYVGWQAGATPGVLEVAPQPWGGTMLRLNLDASRGDARVALLDAAGQPIPGFDLDDCEPIDVDALDISVRWRGGIAPTTLAGSPIGLRFVLRHSTLYTWEYV